MSTLQMKSEEFEMEITYGGNLLTTDNANVLAFTDYLRKFNASAPLATLSLEEKPAGSKHFEYTFTSKEGQSWLQDIIIIGTDPDMNFEADYWKESEFSLNRPVRKEIITLVLGYGVTKIEVTWA